MEPQLEDKVMTQLNIAPLPIAQPAQRAVVSTNDWVGFADAPGYASSRAAIASRAAKSPMRQYRLQADDGDYEGWFSPFHATRAMAFAKG